MKHEIKPVPAIVEFMTFWFGRPETNWQGLQKAFGLTTEQTERLRLQNKAYREGT